MEHQYTEKYKYLGQVKNNKNNAEVHIKEAKAKTEAAFQIVHMPAFCNFNGIAMESL